MRLFAYSLALELGIYDIDAMLASGGHSRLIEWAAFIEIKEEKEKAEEAKARGGKTQSLI